MTRKLMLCLIVSTGLALAGCARQRAEAPASTTSTESAEATESASAPSNPSQEVTLITPIPFAQPGQIRDAIKDECRLGEKLERFIKDYGAESNIAVKSAQGSPAGIPGKVMVVRITDVYAPGGGAFSGGKAVTIEGELFEDGNQVGSLRARRVSGGGAFAAFKGTCDILGRDVKTLGSDVSRFLTDPKEGVRMGNI